MRKVGIIASILVLFLAAGVFAADLAVPEMELITRGYAYEGDFILGTRGSVDFLVAGGYKFGGRVLLGFESNNLEDPETVEFLGFKGAHVVIRNLFGIPFDLTYFTGENDVFCTGEIFPTHFGAKPIASRFSGYLYFPEENQVRYDGIYTVNGTGLKLASGFGSQANLSSMYIYQNSYLGTGTYSLDLFTALNTELFKLEAFLGASYPASVYGYYRAGVLLFYDTGQGGEFLTQIGIPLWDPQNDQFGINLFYFLFEPRVRFDFFSIILTLFWHPRFYFQENLRIDTKELSWADVNAGIDTNELGSADINANFQFGDPDTSIISGGIEARLSLSTTATEQFRTVVAPYFSTITSGVIWDFKLNTQVFPWDVAEMFEMFVGVRAEF
jgi:hypothetical protein